jgi:long-chain fatty acid transport protein
MFQLSPSTRVGVHYRSQLNFELEGNEEYKYTAAGIPGLLAGVSGNSIDVKAKLKTPANFSLAVSQKLSDKWDMLGDVTWTDWSVVSTLFVNNKDTGNPLQKLPYNFKDTWRVGLGANYQYSEALKLRFGVAHDKSPVKHAVDRTMTLPDSDRTWLSFGAKYSLSKNSSVDLGYSHIFFADAKTARAVNTGYPSTETTRQTIRGKFDVSADILSMQYNHAF